MTGCHACAPLLEPAPGRAYACSCEDYCGVTLCLGEDVKPTRGWRRAYSWLIHGKARHQRKR